MSGFADGILRFADLRREFSRGQIESLLAIGRLVRVRRGWYALPHAKPDVVRAVTLGGTLSCVSALRHHGIWVPPDPRLHLRMSEHHQALTRLPDGVHVCPLRDRTAPARAVDTLPTALLAATFCLDQEGIVVVLDSIQNQGLLSRAELASILSPCSRKIRRLLAESDGRAQSGLESMVRFRLRRQGIRVRSQVFVEGVGWVDLLVGDRLVIETDGREHHTGEASYANDRRRDLILVSEDHLILRLTYGQVVYGWDDVLDCILRVVRRRAHLWPRHRVQKPGNPDHPRG